MAGSHSLPKNFGSSVLDHHSARDRYQSNESLNANFSSRLGRQDRTKDKMQLGKMAAPLPALAKLAGGLHSQDLGHHKPKEKQGEGEKKMVSSPMQRRKARAHWQTPTTGGSEV
jgi:hypothetical protein